MSSLSLRPPRRTDESQSACFFLRSFVLTWGFDQSATTESRRKRRDVRPSCICFCPLADEAHVSVASELLCVLRKNLIRYGSRAGVLSFSLQPEASIRCFYFQRLVCQDVQRETAKDFGLLRRRYDDDGSLKRKVSKPKLRLQKAASSFPSRRRTA